MENHDLVVIGSGPAGRRAAIQAAKIGKSVVVVENRLRVGGVSVHTGTIPSKTSALKCCSTPPAASAPLPSRTRTCGIEGGMMKLIFALESRRLLGAHIIGEGATELIHIGQAVLNLGGTVDYFVENAFNDPTLVEAYKIAALDGYNRMR